MLARSRLTRRVAVIVSAVALLAANAALGSPAAGATAAGATAAGCLVNSVVPEAGLDERCRTERWAAVYDDEPLYAEDTPLSHGRQLDLVEAMAVSPSGNRVFTLVADWQVYNARRLVEWSLLAHDAATGEQRWVTRIPADRGNLQLTQLAVSADGRRVYVGGTYSPYVSRRGDGETPLIHDVAVTSGFDTTTGERLWGKRFPPDPDVGIRPPEPDWFRDGVADPEYNLHADAELAALTVSPTADTVYLTGFRDGGSTFYDLAVVAYEGSTGDIRWAQTYDTSSEEAPYAPDRAAKDLAAVSPNGQRLYVGGCRPCGTMLTYRASDGQLLDTAPTGEGSALALAPDGSRMYLFDKGTVNAVDPATGAKHWSVTVRDAVDMAVSPRGDVIALTGPVAESEGNGGGDWETVTYDAVTGKRLWQARYDGVPADTVGDPDGSRFNGDATDRPSSVAVSPDGTAVYVTGTSRRTVGEDRATTSTDAIEGSWATVAYDVADGKQLWSARYRQLLYGAEGNRDRREVGPLVAVGPDGTVFAAGNVDTQFSVVGARATTSLRGNRTDVVVLAYDP